MKGKILVAVCTAFILQFVGVYLSAYGVVRESFVELSRETGGFSFPHQPVGRQPTGHQPSFDPDSFDTDSFAGRPSAVDQLLVGADLRLGLLPSEQELTPEHRRQNARWAVVGVFLVLGGMLLNAIVKGRRALWMVVMQISKFVRTVGQWIRRSAASLKSIISRR